MIQFRPAAAGASEAARYIVLAADRHGAGVDHLLLQQLLFAAQGWSLVDRGRPLFADDLEAWPVGPVAPAVYREYEQFGMQRLEAPSEDTPALTEEDRALLEEVVLGYVTGESPLSSASQGEAWRGARRNLPLARPSHRKITLEAIQEEFARRASSASAAIDRRLDALTRAGASNAKLIFGASPIKDA